MPGALVYDHIITDLSLAVDLLSDEDISGERGTPLMQQWQKPCLPGSIYIPGNGLGRSHGG